MRDKELIDTLNSIIKTLEPIKLDEFNPNFKEKRKNSLIELEKQNTKIGIKKDSVSILSLIATITDILIDKRLAFIVNDEKFIIGVDWYKNDK